MEEEIKTRSKKKKKKKRRVLRFFGSIIMLMGVVIGVYIIDVYRHVDNTTHEIYVPIEKNEVESVRESNVSLSSEDPISILLLGIDTEGLSSNERGRSDSMILATVNPNTGKTVLTSIPRDSFAEIVGYGTYDKINHAYAFGGTGMTINSVQNLLDIPIDYYVTINMAGIKELVDAVGGIDVVSPLTFNVAGYQFNQGEAVHLNGESSLGFARMRYEDPEGDTGRQARQRIVIEGVVNKITSPSTLLNYQDILGSLSNNIQTNFQMSDYFSLQSNNYLKAVNNITSEQIGGYGEIAQDGIYYHYIPDGELIRIQNLLQTELEI